MDHFYQSRSLLCLLEKDGKSLKKVKKKKRKCKDGTERERERDKIRSSSIPVRDFSNFGRRRFGIEDVEQIADRRSQIGTRASIDEETFRVTKNSSPRPNACTNAKRFLIIVFLQCGHIRGNRQKVTQPSSSAIRRSRSTQRSPLVVCATSEQKSRIGLCGLAVMGQNLALNVAEKGFPISVYNRSGEKTDGCVKRAEKEGLSNNLRGYKDFKEFVESIEKPRHIIILVKAGAPVDATIEGLSQFLEPGDCIIDGGNEWYENTERRLKQVQEKGLLYLGMGVSGGEEGARNGPSMMPGGSEEAYKRIEDILKPVSAQTNTGACVTYVGKGGG